MRQELSKYQIDESNFDMNNWTPFDLNHLSEEHKNIFEKRKRAIHLYLNTSIELSEIYEHTGIRPSTLYHLLDRCFMLQTDGSIYGFSGLIPSNRLQIRTSKFSQFLENNPNIKYFVVKKFKQSKLKLRTIHQSFLNFILKNGITSSQYPFTLADKGYRELYRYHKQWISKEKSLEPNDFLPVKMENLSNYTTRPLEEVEVDGHRIDAYFITEFQTPSGTWREAVIERPWLLCTIDRSSRCILGYHLVLKSAYDADDVVTCIEKSIIPQEYELHNPYLKNLIHGGLPNTVFEEAKYALFDELYLDNALAHLAQHTIDTLVSKLGIKLCFGKVAEPTRRGIIERFFETLEESSFHSLPSTTGSNKDDSRRTDPEENARKYRISVNDLEDILQLTIFNYNAKSHQSLFGNSPLEDFRQKFDGILQVYLPIELRTGEQFHIKIDKRRVVSNGVKDNYLHINYAGAKYTNERLSKEALLKGQTLNLHINRLDLRVIKAFYPNGQLYGELVVEKKWRSRKHSLKERQIINKLAKNGSLNSYNSTNIIEDYDHYILNQRKPDKRTGARIALRNKEKELNYSSTAKTNLDNKVKKNIPDPVELTKNRRKPFKIKSINL